MIKTCFKCNVPKQIEDFYEHRGMSDGRLGKCIECCKKEANKRRSEKLEEIQQYDRDRSNLPHRSAARVKYFKDHQFGEERRARQAVANAVRDGRLKKMFCAVCKAEKVESHHEDYEKPLEVIWLCKKHHVEADKVRRKNVL